MKVTSEYIKAQSHLLTRDAVMIELMRASDPRWPNSGYVHECLAMIRPKATEGQLNVLRAAYSAYEDALKAVIAETGEGYHPQFLGGDGLRDMKAVDVAPHSVFPDRDRLLSYSYSVTDAFGERLTDAREFFDAALKFYDDGLGSCEPPDGPFMRAAWERMLIAYVMLSINGRDWRVRRRTGNAHAFTAVFPAKKYPFKRRNIVFGRPFAEVCRTEMMKRTRVIPWVTLLDERTRGPDIEKEFLCQIAREADVEAAQALVCDARAMPFNDLANTVQRLLIKSESDTAVIES